MIIKLGKDARAEVIASVLGQLSDGIWENSSAMDKYWMFADVEGTDLVIDDEPFRDETGWGRYGSTIKRTQNGFADKSEKQIKDWFANKAKQVVKIWAEDYGKDPNAVWNRNNLDKVTYMGHHRMDVTVADVYECYDFLKGRGGHKYGVSEEPAPVEIDEVVEPEVSGGMNPSQQDLEDFFLDASTHIKSSKSGTKYPSGYVKADIDRIEKARGACYIDNWSPYNKTYNVLENILDMANRCLRGSGLSVPDIDSIGVADNGQLLGFYELYKTKSGNSYSIGWHPGGWKLFIYDELDANTLSVLAEVMADFNETFKGVKFHEDRPII